MRASVNGAPWKVPGLEKEEVQSARHLSRRCKFRHFDFPLYFTMPSILKFLRNTFLTCFGRPCTRQDEPEGMHYMSTPMQSSERKSSISNMEKQYTEIAFSEQARNVDNLME